LKIGKRIKTVRVAKGLSQARLSHLSSVSQAYISELEADEKNPTISIVQKLATALGVKVSDLLEDQAS